MIPFPDARATIKWRESAVNSRPGDDDGPNRMGCCCALRHRAGGVVRLHGKANLAQAKPNFLVRPDASGGCFANAFGRVH